jgi:hypothetical protein
MFIVDKLYILWAIRYKSRITKMAIKDHKNGDGAKFEVKRILCLIK